MGQLNQSNKSILTNKLAFYWKGIVLISQGTSREPLAVCWAVAVNPVCIIIP